MIEPICIHHADTPDEVRARHLRIQQRLEQLGHEQVRAMQGHALPTQWDPIIREWLAGKRLDEAKN